MDAKIVISGIIDSNVAVAYPKLGLIPYDTVSKLKAEVDKGPVVADTLYITEDIIRYNPNSVFAELVELYKSPFFQVDQTIFIVPANSQELKRIEFLQQRDKLGNVSIIKGEITKEFVLSVLRGSASAGKTAVKRKEVVRHRRGEYVQQKRIESQFAETDTVETETDRLSAINTQEEIPREETHIAELVDNGEMVQITGIDQTTIGMFAVVLSQYLAGYGRAILFETDLDYFTISTLVASSEIKALSIPIERFYQSPVEVVNLIKETDHKLICIVGTSADKGKGYRPYNIIHTLYHLAKKYIKYFIIPTTIDDLLASMRSIVVTNNDILSIIKTAYNIPSTSIDRMQFVGIHCKYDAIAIKDSQVVSSIISEITNTPVNVPIYEINSLRLDGGDMYDLHRYVKGLS
jgi:hypothetical protein